MTSYHYPSRPSVPSWTPTAPPPAPARRTPRTVALVAAAALIAGAAGGAVGAATAADDDAAAPAATDSADVARTSFAEGTVSDVAARVLPSVVSVDVRGQDGAGSGSGVVLDDDGRILTNNHVVEPGVDGAISVVFQDGSRADAEIVGRDAVTDLAVLDVDDVERRLQPVEVGRSRDVAVGDAVVAIGSPLGLSGTVTTGIVSALDRTVRTSPEAPLLGAIQTDASINPGNSGGALVDASGRLIGINTAISTTGAGGGSIGLGFAIPIDEARSVAAELIRTGQATHPSLGVAAATVTEGGDSERSGAQLQQVPADSAAARGGLRQGDVVIAVDGSPVTGVDELVLALRQLGVGQTAQITYVRDGQEADAEVVLAYRRA